MGEIYLYLSLACLWNLMAGYAGLVSVGQQAYVGFGGYMLFALTVFAGLHPVVAILVGGLLAAAVSVPIATLIFRLKGAYFAIGTWVVAEVFRLSFAQIQALGRRLGVVLPVAVVKELGAKKAAREATSYWLALGAAVVVLLAVYLFLRSRRGLALTAIRDSETAASGLGIDIWRTKLEVYVVTSAFTAIIGGLIFLQKAPHLARRGLQRERLDGVRDLHRRDRRHRHAGRADHRHALVLCVARSAGRFRHDLPDGAGAGGDRRHAESAERRLGPDPRPL